MQCIHFIIVSISELYLFIIYFYHNTANLSIEKLKISQIEKWTINTHSWEVEHFRQGIAIKDL